MGERWLLWSAVETTWHDTEAEAREAFDWLVGDIRSEAAFWRDGHPTAIDGSGSSLCRLELRRGRVWLLGVAP